MEELKLEDFRSNKRLNVPKSIPEEQPTFSAESQVSRNNQYNIHNLEMGYNSVIKLEKIGDDRKNFKTVKSPSEAINYNLVELPENNLNCAMETNPDTEETLSHNSFFEVNLKACQKRYYKIGSSAKTVPWQNYAVQPTEYKDLHIDCPDNCSETLEVDTDIEFGDMKNILVCGNFYPKISAIHEKSNDIWEVTPKTVTPSPPSLIIEDEIEDKDLKSCGTEFIFDVPKSPEPTIAVKSCDEDVFLESLTKSNGVCVKNEEKAQVDVAGGIVQNDPNLNEKINESLGEVPDEEIYKVLKNFSNVRLISPLKEIPRRMAKNTKQKRLFDFEPVAKCLKVVALECERTQSVQEKYIQTEEVYCLDKMVQTECNGRNWSISSTDALITKIWKKLRTMDRVGNVCRTQASFISFMRMLIKFMNFHSVNMKKKKNNQSTKGKAKSNIGNKTFWKVENLSENNPYSSSPEIIRNDSICQLWNDLNSFVAPLEQPINCHIGEQKLEFELKNDIENIYENNCIVKPNVGMQNYYSSVTVKKANDMLPTCALTDVKCQTSETTIIHDSNILCTEPSTEVKELRVENQTDGPVISDKLIPRRSTRILERNKSKDADKLNGTTMKLHPDMKEKLETLFGHIEEPCKEITTQCQIDENSNNEQNKTFVTKEDKPRSSRVGSTNQKRVKLGFVNSFDMISPIEEEKRENRGEVLNKTGDPNILDSILTAMTKQAEEYKFISPLKSRQSCLTGSHPWTSSENQANNEMSNQVTDCKPQFMHSKMHPPVHLDGRLSQKEAAMKKFVEREIHEFLSLSLNSVQEAEQKMKSCISVLEKATEDVIASVIVGEVMANVDEELQVFDRPAPPLTPTQHRLITILTVLNTENDRFASISYKILRFIRLKLFPETFFWPDDSVEMATRFYSALCKKLNDFKTMWKFCFKAMSSMKQRWCIPIFVVIQVWPDILHNASEVHDNVLVTTFVNVILHTPKIEGERRKRQQEKLLAIKHLLLNFYNFEVNVTIEDYTAKLFRSFLEGVAGSLDAFVLVAKCRNWEWTRKYVLSKLMDLFCDWSKGNVDFHTGVRTLDLIQQITSIFPNPGEEGSQSVADFVAVFMQLFSSGRLGQELEEKAVKILCSLKNHASVKETLSSLLPKFSANVQLCNEMMKAINAKPVKQPSIKSKNRIRKGSVYKKKTKKTKKKKKKSTSPPIKLDCTTNGY